MKKVDVLLIGSGISALTAGLLLAKQGKSVLILEQHTKIGGYLHCFKRFGEKFDTGAHYIGSLEPGQPFHTLMNYLGIWHPEDYVPLDPEGFDEFYFPEFRFSIPKGYEALESRLSKAFPEEASGIREICALIQKAVKYFATYKYNDFLPENFPLEIFDRSLSSVVESHVTAPGLRSILYAYCSHHGASPQDVSFGFHSVIIDTLISGAYGFKNGGEQLAERYKTEIEKLGGRILCKQKVTRLEVKDRAIKAVHTEKGDVFAADWIISAIHPRNTFQLIDDDSSLSPIFKSRVQQLKEGPSFFGIYALLKDRKFCAPDKNYFFFSSSEPDDFGSTIFMSPAQRDPKPEALLTPVNIHALAPYEWFSKWNDSRYGRRPEEYKLEKEKIAAKIFQTIETHRPGFTASIEKFETSTALSHIHFNGSHQGSAYGIDHGMAQSGPRAIGPRTKILNLLLTGQNSLFPGLLGSAISGLRSAGHIVGIKHMLHDLKERQNEDSPCVS
jgi:phytoene dehydrogenase-like protein